MLTTNKLILAAVISNAIAFSASAAVPHTFQSGEAAVASEVNENFSDLDSRVTAANSGLTTLNESVGDLGTDVGALETSVTGINTRLGTAEGKVTTLEGKMTSAEGTITTLSTDVGTLQTTVSGLPTTGTVSAIDGRVTTVEGTLATLATSSTVTAIEGRVAAAETEIDSLATASDVDALELRVDDAESDITALESDTTALESDVDDLELTVAGLATSTALDAVAVRATNVESDVATLKSEMDVVETGVADLNTDVANLDSLVGTNVSDISTLRTDVDDLGDRVDTLESSGGGGGAYDPAYSQTVDIDCTNDIDALFDALYDLRNTTTRMDYRVTGTCNGGEVIRSDVRIEGVSNAVINVPTILDEDTGEPLFDGAFYIDKQSNVRITNVTLNGKIDVIGNSNVRLENVSLPNAVWDAVKKEYLFNVDVKSSYLQIKKGSINELALHANRNSTVDIRSAVDGAGKYVLSDANSSVVIDSPSVTFDLVEAIGSAFIYANHLEADEVVAEGTSIIEADSLTITNSGVLEAWGSARISVWGDATVSGDVNVSNSSSIVVDGMFSTNNFTCEFASSASFEDGYTASGFTDIHQGCFAKVEGEPTFTGGYYVGDRSSLIKVVNDQWIDVVNQ